MQYELAGACTSTRSGAPTCSTGQYTTSVRTVLFGPLRGLGSADRDYFAIYPALKLLKLGNVDVASQNADCSTPAFGAGSYSVRCFADLNSFILESVVSQPANGACPSIPPKPTIPRVATLRPEWPPEAKRLVLELFGRSDEPVFESVELR
jgi:hypothetical protein